MLSIINELRQINGTKDKLAYIDKLPKYAKDLFEKVLLATMTPNVNYNVEIIPEYTPNNNSTKSLEEAILEIQSLTGSIEEKRDDYLVSILESVSADDAKVIEMILRDKLNIGLKNKTLKKSFPNFPQPHPYNRCSSFSKKNISKLTFPMYSQTKEDGMYIDVIGKKCFTRSGNEVKVLKDETLEKLDELFGGYVIQGEILHVDENGNVLNRQESNGESNKKEVNVENTRFVIFDVIPITDFEEGKCDIPYKNRWELITYRQPDLPEQCVVVECKVVNNISEVAADFKSKLQRNLEGCILKDFDACWKNGTNPQFVKLKIECSVELKVTGIEPGTKGSKYESMIGALNVESSDGKVRFNVGSGLTDEQRALPEDTYNGKIVTVKFNDIVQNRDEPDYFALYLPRIIEVRQDRTDADSYERIVETLNAIDDIIENVFEKEN